MNQNRNHRTVFITCRGILMKNLAGFTLSMSLPSQELDKTTHSSDFPGILIINARMPLVDKQFKKQIFIHLVLTCFSINLSVRSRGAGAYIQVGVTVLSCASMCVSFLLPRMEDQSTTGCQSGVTPCSVSTSSQQNSLISQASLHPPAPPCL